MEPMDDKYSFWVHLLLEGELPPDREEEVFELLARHPELREEFRHLVIMQRSLREQKVMTPPPAVTQGVFARIFSKKWGVGKFALFVAGVVTGIMLSIGAFWIGWGELSSPGQQVAEVPQVPVVEFEFPRSQRYRAIADTVSHQLPQIVDENTSGWRKKGEIRHRAAETAALPFVAPARTIEIEAPGRLKAPLPKVGINPIPAPPGLSDWIVAVFDWSRFGGEYQEKMLLSSQPGAMPAFPAIGRQFQVNFGYDLDEQQELGLVIGRENFPQRFYLEAHREGSPGTVREDVRVHYEQNPQLWWGGLFYRYRQELLPGVWPFVDVAVGATRIGPVGKLTLGAALQLSNHFAVRLGVENSALVYQVYERIFATHKLSLTYGLSVKF